MIQELAQTALTSRDKRLPINRGPRRTCQEKQAQQKSTIVVPIDLNLAHTSSLDYAIAQACRLDSRVLVVHVVERFYGEGLMEQHERERLQKGALWVAEKKLKKLMASKKGVDVPIVIEVRNGLPVYEILKAAEAAKAELIIIGRGKRGILSRMIFGSVTENLLDASQIPVLVITSGR